MNQVLVTILLNKPRALAVSGRTGCKRPPSSDPSPGLEARSCCQCLIHTPGRTWSTAGALLALGWLCHTQGTIQPPASLMLFQHSGNCFSVISCRADWIASSSPDWHAASNRELEVIKISLIFPDQLRPMADKEREEQQRKTDCARLKTVFHYSFQS